MNVFEDLDEGDYVIGLQCEVCHCTWQLTRAAWATGGDYLQCPWRACGSWAVRVIGGLGEQDGQLVADVRGQDQGDLTAVAGAPTLADMSE